ncbi:MAG TPA: histidine kinase [Anaerolineaceae bacterium]|nr:histidine kinase [Anaerolineaceae bacterium]HPN50841.1 histidine kinase [Anaerolineaceae bacterium]
MAESVALRNDGDTIDPWDEFQHEIVAELEQSQRALREITLMLEQSQVEMNKLTQRNQAVTVRLQQMQAQSESLSRAEIRMAYDAALDSQQRLFVMRGQIEKYQSDQSHLQRYVNVLNQTVKMLEERPAKQQSKGQKGSASIEMMVNAQESERQRLSRAMHDGPAQALSNFILQTEIATRLFDIDQAKAREELNNLKSAAEGTFEKVRNFIFELRPMMLDDLGLIPTMERYAGTFKSQTGLETNLIITGTERRLEPYMEVMIFRTLQELMGNAARHAQASLLKVSVKLDEANIRISVEDNGRGFDTEALSGSNGLGLKLIRERADMLGGSFDIDSVIGQGTRIALQLPCPSPQ